MAKILLTAFVDAISGSIKGTTFSRNRSGAYVAGKKVTKFKAGSELGDSVNHGSGAVQTQRARFSEISKAWRTLTNIERRSFNSTTEDWKSKDSLGNMVTPSGFNVFVSLNMIAKKLVGLADGPKPEPFLIKNPPLKADLTTAQSMELNLKTATMVVTVPVATSPLGVHSLTNAVLIEATRPMSPGITRPSESDFRMILVNAQGTNQVWDVVDEYGLVFGAPIADQKVFIRISIVDCMTGQKGVPLMKSSKIVQSSPDGD